MGKRSFFAALGLAAIFALIAAGCGGGNNESSGNQGGQSGSTPSETTGGTGATGGTLTVAVGSEPPSLDPGLATDTTSAYVVGNINLPITRLGPAPDLAAQPGLAESWDTSGSTVTLHLRDDVKWTNGQPVTADDVVWSWLRTISPELAADYAYQFFSIKGASEYNACDPKKDDCNALKKKVGVSAPDAHTVKIELVSAQPWFIQQLAHTSFIPVNKQAVKQWGDKWTEPEHIVTDGPFQLTAWKHDASLTLKKWDGYVDADNVSLDTVQLNIITDGSTALQAFQSGEVDVNDTGWPVSNTAQLKQTPEYHQFQALGTYYYGFNIKNIPDVNQRKAMAFAIDRKTIVEKITQNGQVPATGFTPAGMPGADSINANNIIPPTADVDQAKQFMSQVSNPVKDITLFYNNAPGHKEIAIAIQSMWKQNLGLNVSLKQQEWPQFLQFLGPPPNDAVDVYRLGWVADYPDDINFLNLWTCDSGNNNTNYCNKTYDQLVQKAYRTPDDTARYQLYQQMEDMLTGPDGDFPIMPIYWYTYVDLQKSTVKGYVINPMDFTDLTKVSIEQ